MDKVNTAICAGRMPTAGDVESIADLEDLYAGDCPAKETTMSDWYRGFAAGEKAAERDKLDGATLAAIEIGAKMGVSKEQVLRERVAELESIAGTSTARTRDTIAKVTATPYDAFLAQYVADGGDPNDDQALRAAMQRYRSEPASADVVGSRR